MGRDIHFLMFDDEQKKRLKEKERTPLLFQPGMGLAKELSNLLTNSPIPFIMVAEQPGNQTALAHRSRNSQEHSTPQQNCPYNQRNAADPSVKWILPSEQNGDLHAKDTNDAMKHTDQKLYEKGN